ncbi:hypothetical protein B7494_g521 [Chlorociboria aeruginascens]|nr:hypothetical protein B7494_g521 [Chlorociboria aeruginascens]
MAKNQPTDSIPNEKNNNSEIRYITTSQTSSDVEAPFTNEVVVKYSIERGLNPGHMRLIPFGGTIGTGLFASSGKPLTEGGPCFLLVCYAILWALVYILVVALTEITTVSLWIERDPSAVDTLFYGEDLGRFCSLIAIIVACLIAFAFALEMLVVTTMAEQAPAGYLSAYMTFNSTANTVFNWMLNLINTGGFISWVCSIIYIRFGKAIEVQNLAFGHTITSHSQLALIGTWIILTMFSSLCFLNGFIVFFPGQWSAVPNFLSAYIGLPIFIVVYLIHRTIYWTDSWVHKLKSIDLVTELDVAKADEKLAEILTTYCAATPQYSYRQRPPPIQNH